MPFAPQKITVGTGICFGGLVGMIGVSVCIFGFLNICFLRSSTERTCELELIAVGILSE